MHFDDLLLSFTAILSAENIKNNGGPFAAVIVSYDNNNQPNNITGWSAPRSISLGVDILKPIYKFL